MWEEISARAPYKLSLTSKAARKKKKKGPIVSDLAVAAGNTVPAEFIMLITHFGCSRSGDLQILREVTQYSIGS
jgi:hypothetical protein